MTSLSLNDIAALLNDNSIRPKPKQAGPLKYNSTKLNIRCSVCNTPCMIEVSGKPFCTNHTIYALNKIALGTAIIAGCSCEAGSKTMYSLHTSDCVIYNQLPE